MCRGVVGAGNNKVVRCNSVGVVIHKVIGGLWMVLLVWIILWIELWIRWEMRKRLRGFYPVKNAGFVIAF